MFKTQMKSFMRNGLFVQEKMFFDKKVFGKMMIIIIIIATCHTIVDNQICQNVCWYIKSCLEQGEMISKKFQGNYKLHEITTATTIHHLLLHRIAIK